MSETSKTLINVNFERLTLHLIIGHQYTQHRMNEGDFNHTRKGNTGDTDKHNISTYTQSSTREFKIKKN